MRLCCPVFCALVAGCAATPMPDSATLTGSPMSGVFLYNAEESTAFNPEMSRRDYHLLIYDDGKEVRVTIDYARAGKGPSRITRYFAGECNGKRLVYATVNRKYPTAEVRCERRPENALFIRILDSDGSEIRQTCAPSPDRRRVTCRGWENKSPLVEVFDWKDNLTPEELGTSSEKE